MALPRYIPDYTVEDYALWEGQWELWSGVPVAMSPSADKRHQRISGELYSLLKDALREQGCADCDIYFELDWVAAPDTVYRPDVVIVCGDRPSRHLETTPVFVAEVLSASTRQRDLLYKRDSYAQLGVRYYAILDPEGESVELLEFQGEGYQSVPHRTRLILNPNCEIEVDLSQALI